MLLRTRVSRGTPAVLRGETLCVSPTLSPKDGDKGGAPGGVPERGPTMGAEDFAA